MTDLRAHYNQLFLDSFLKISSGNYQKDHLINSPLDRRMGLTLIVKPDIYVRNAIKQFLDELEGVDPSQYYYPVSDMHITVLSVISCYNDFSLTNINLLEYIHTISQAIQGIKPFNIDFTGITASPACILIQGFPQDATLQQLRNAVRSEFKSSNLQQSIDKRYTLQTAHVTTVRFKENIQNLPGFLNLVEAYRTHQFGLSTIQELELVYNDWYHREEKVQSLHKFQLK